MIWDVLLVAVVYTSEKHSVGPLLKVVIFDVLDWPATNLSEFKLRAGLKMRRW